MHKTYPLHQSPLFRLRSRSRLASLLGVSVGDLRRLSKLTESLYSEFEVAKKRGGTRPVEHPKRELKKLQARVARLLSRIQAPDYLYCPVKGRSYVGNAAQHRGNKVVRCLDVKKYFPSTSSRRVFWFFHKIMGCERDLAATLTALATYKGHLPTGSPLSPIMAYFAHIDVWEKVKSICDEAGCQITVYIDDVTVSGYAVSGQVMWSIKQAIFASGLRYHKEKVFFGVPAEITGVIVSGQGLKVPNRQLKKLDVARRQMRRYPGRNRALANMRSGLEGQVEQIKRFS